MYEKTLSNLGETKQIYLLGWISGQPSETKALVKLEKPTFEEKHMQTFTETEAPIKEEEKYFNNDVYYKYYLQMSPEIAKV